MHEEIYFEYPIIFISNSSDNYIHGNIIKTNTQCL